jgi:hypothetical protein
VLDKSIKIRLDFIKYLSELAYSGNHIMVILGRLSSWELTRVALINEETGK